MKTILILLAIITTSLSNAETTVQNIDEATAETPTETELILNPAQFYCKKTKGGFAIYKDQFGPINSKIGSYTGGAALENFKLCETNYYYAQYYAGSISIDLASGKTELRLSTSKWELKSVIDNLNYYYDSRFVCETPKTTCFSAHMPPGTSCECYSDRGTKGVHRSIYSKNGQVDVF
jgi:hypothetical protein